MSGRGSTPAEGRAALADELAREIKRLRTEAGMSQRLLAGRIGYSRQYVSMAEWEDANLPSRELIAAIDAILNAGGRLILLRQRASSLRAQRRPRDRMPSMSEGEEQTNRRDALRTIGVGAAAGAGLQDLVLNAAQSSSSLNGLLNRPAVEATTVESAAGDLRRVATEYVLNPDLGSVLIELISIRDILAAQLAHAVKPSEMSDLYVLMAVACSLLGSVSHDLAEPKAAVIQSRIALRFAELAGHRSLITWAYCTWAMVHSWWGTANDVLEVIERVGDPYGLSAARLSGLAARAYADMGDKDSAHEALTRACDERSRSSDGEALTQFGATFSFSLARQHYYNSMVHADLGDWSRALIEAGETIGMYAPAKADTWPATLTLAEINSARSLLHLEGPDAALQSLWRVLETPNGQRIPQVIAGIDRVWHDLRAGWSGDESGKALDDAIREFKTVIGGVG
ncbi:helix-turn-helix transcriptional regulator [Nocardia testacea]|uniref:helix-turn-helix transcriptional regulator n=1 Tax=Nocardia testacea TaxID=248551 RepID=UPI0034066715